ncbi:MAG: HAMP domain-containing protein [Anaerolineae bacterium]|nr:HAMP domain-containing protein [Anaerolineae bacterium]
MTRSLRTRLSLWALLLFGATQAVISILIYLAITTWLSGQLENSLVLIAEQLAADFYNEDDPFHPLDMEEAAILLDTAGTTPRVYLGEEPIYLRLIDLPGRRGLAQSPTIYDLGIPMWDFDGMPRFEIVDSGTNGDLLMHNLRLSYDPSTILQAGISLRGLQAARGAIATTLFGALLVAVFAAWTSGAFLADRALKPIRAITHAAGATSETDLTRRLDVRAADVELRTLAETFNAMLERIEGAFRRQKQFTADAAHELRTPLANMQARIDVTLSQPRDADTYRSALESAGEEVGRLTSLTTLLLRLARGELQPQDVAKSPVDLSLLLDAVSDQFAPAASEKGVTLRRQIAPGLSVRGDEERLIQIAYNLIDNAVKYTSAGGSVTVTALAEGSEIHFSIADTGAGIPEADQARVFDRFFRVDRARRQGGFGLGLAIVRQNVELHGGTILLISREGRGSEFRVVLPVFR